MLPSVLSHRRRKEIASLSRRKYRDKLRQFLVEGVRSVEAAVDAGAPLIDVLVADDQRDEPRVQALLARLTVPVYLLPPAELAPLADTATPSGLLAVAETRLHAPDTLLSASALLALDAVQDPGNVGALIRSAAWFGIDAVVAGPGTADVFNPKAVRASMGGIWDVKLARTDDLPAFLQALTVRGTPCYRADLAGPPASAWHPGRPACLVLGNEAHGVSEAVRAAVAQSVRIQGGRGQTGVESLNVAVAAGILLHRMGA